MKTESLVSAPVHPTLKSDTENSLSSLEVRYRSALGIVPFVGAGISKQLHLPTWAEFLTIRAADLGPQQVARTRQLLNQGLFEDAADELAQGAARNAFQQTMEAEFGDKKLESSKGYPGILTSGAQGLIPFITQGPVITTNFDHVLEHVFRQRGRPFKKFLFPNQHGLSESAFADNEPCLLKLHGDVSDVNTQVITRTDYKTRYEDQRDLPELLARVFKRRPLLFLGCSLNRDRTLDVFCRAVETPSYTPHFAILEAPEDPTNPLEVRRREFLRSCNISLIWYPSRRYEWVEKYLQQIVGKRAGLDKIYGPEREIAIVYSHLTLAPEITRYIEDRKPKTRNVLTPGETLKAEEEKQQKEILRLTSLQTYFLVPGEKDGTPKFPNEHQQKCRGTKVACVCEARSASYLSSEFARIGFLADPIRGVILAHHELESKPHRTCIYLGIRRGGNQDENGR